VLAHVVDMLDADGHDLCRSVEKAVGRALELVDVPERLANRRRVCVRHQRDCPWTVLR
jgi:hypothetical protein